MPSFVFADSAIILDSYSICPSRESKKLLWTKFFNLPNARDGPAASFFAKLCASSFRSLKSTTLFINPQSSASFALKTLFVNTSSVYLLVPIILGKKYVEDPSGVNPIFE